MGLLMNKCGWCIGLALAANTLVLALAVHKAEINYAQRRVVVRSAFADLDQETGLSYRALEMTDQSTLWCKTI